MHARINEIIKKSGLTKTDAAKKLGLSQSFVSRICSGEASPSDRTITDICREFGCDEVWLRTGEGEPFRQETREEIIMRFAVQTIKSSNEFRKSVVVSLAKLPDYAWGGLEAFLTILGEGQRKD